jgi:transcriptional regulator with XRE-family HTH domain
MKFKKIIEEITARGWPQHEIAAECEVTQGQISSLARGHTVQPLYFLGVALVELHRSGKPPPPKVKARVAQ